MYLTKSELEFLKAKGRTNAQIKRLKQIQEVRHQTVSTRAIRTDFFGFLAQKDTKLPYY